MKTQRTVGIVSVGVALASLVACAHSGAADRAGVIVEPTAKSRLALQNAVSRALGASYVVLADDALTTDDTLFVEPARVREFGGQRVQGRETRMPERFHLVKEGKTCILIHERTGQRTSLVDTECKNDKKK